MSFLVPIALFGWIPFTGMLFFYMKPHRAVLISIIGGNLFLPNFTYALQGLPDYSKAMAIAIGLIIGGELSGARKAKFKGLKIYDLPMFFWCICPLMSSLTNNLGFYDGISEALDHTVYWGIPYLAGRIYFNSSREFKDALLAISIGGLCYAPLCLFEIRMSPQLNNIVYGFFPHSWLQHVRYGGFRPIVFMQHGLMVSLWMAVTTTVTFWLWRSRTEHEILNIPTKIVFFLVSITTLLCKSVNGWFAMTFGCLLYLILKDSRVKKTFMIFLSIIPIYMISRSLGYISANEITNQASKYIDADRVESLSVRLTQEELFIRRALERPFFGWGGYGRNWPVDPITGEQMIRMVDALWIVAFSKYGSVGLISLYASMLIGPFLAFRKLKSSKDATMNTQATILCIVILLFTIDTLLNAMINNIYILVAGIVVNTYYANENKSLLPLFMSFRHLRYKATR